VTAAHIMTLTGVLKDALAQKTAYKTLCDQMPQKHCSA